MKKEVKENQGFICKNLEDKKRIWEKLTDAGYPMHSSYEDCDKDYPHIVFSTSEFCGGFSQNITEYLNEDEFFGETEWTPKPGEWVEVSSNGKEWNKEKRQYLCTINRVHLCVICEQSYKTCDQFGKWLHIRQIQPETMTLQEVREALGKPNLIIE
jgi:hypothetical protein